MISRFKNADMMIIVATLALVAGGTLMVYSTSFVMAAKKIGDGEFFFKKHLIFAVAGLIVFLAASRIPYGIYRKLTYPLLIAAAIALILIYIPGIGHKVGGARRWIKLPGFAFQPSELGKLAVVVFLAYSLEAKRERIRDFWYGFLPNMIIPGFIILLILFETDLGTSLTLSAVVFLMSIVGGIRLKHLSLALLPIIPALVLVVLKFKYMLNRILIFLDPWKDPDGAGFQTIQSLLAFGSGGLFGVGLGDGKQKLFYLPEAHTDFIFSVVGEELGFLGVAAVIAFYGLFLVGGTVIAMRAKDLFGTYLALGLTLMITLQAAVNMAVVMGVLPPKGITLPFISYGGTSLLVSLFAAGVILNVCIEGNED